MRHGAGYWVFHYGLLALFVAFALFPLFWLFKVSITPNDLLYSEGVRLWPDRKSTRLNSSHSGESRMPSSA